MPETRQFHHRTRVGKVSIGTSPPRPWKATCDSPGPPVYCSDFASLAAVGRELALA